MKNLKKLSRNELKAVKGSALIDGPTYWACIKNYKWCEKTKTCIPVASDCNAFEIPTPVDDF